MERARLAWPAFWLSLAVPGAGQLLARSWTAAIWFALVAGVIVCLAHAAPQLATLSASLLAMLQAIALLTIGVASAAHARRLCLRRASSVGRESLATVGCQMAHGRRVSLSVEVPTALSSMVLWQRISDLPHFLTIDPFHERVVLMRRTPAAGVDLVLDHNAFGFRLRRVGRILWWREGEGYAISDLSRREKQCGFPHVFTFRIRPAADAAHGGGAVLCVEIRGKWTSRVIPAWLARWWLVGVCREHARLLQEAL